ncbi:MAG: hypothetical protein AAFV88_08485 [Planctomycetota bacterium]
MARSSAADSATGVAHSAHSAVDRVRTDQESIHVDVEKLFLITNALWTIMKEEHGYSDEDLIKKVDEIDLQDGKLDGKLEKPKSSTACDQCGRNLMARRNMCMYCGHRQSGDPFRR